MTNDHGETAGKGLSLIYFKRILPFFICSVRVVTRITRVDVSRRYQSSHALVID